MTVHLRLVGVCLVVVVVFTAEGLAAEDWPQWRGPLASGVAAAGEYPTNFSSDEAVAWKVELPGAGCSTPIVWGDSIYVTSGDDGKDAVVSYGMDGRERWRHTFGAERPGKHRNGSGSNPSPATDGKHLVVYYKSGTLACFSLEGEEKWQFNVQEKYGPDTLWWDLGTSPVIADNRVILAVMQGDDSYLAAFDIDTGKELWKVPRKYVCMEESDQAYTTPQVVNVDGRDQLVVWGADHLTGHDLDTGDVIWECGGFNPNGEANWRVIASPAIESGMAIVPYGRGEYLAGVRLGGKGDVTGSARVWEKQGRGVSSDVPTPAVRDGRAYVLNDAGRIVCLNVGSGDELWSDDLPRNRNKYFSSPVIGGDKLYAAREDGMIFVGRITDDGFELLSENDMGEPTIAAPVPIRGGLLVRGREHLFRIED
ncbi:MAG: PQQ-binding-like beta-propeller repeat protein [Pirellulales bacterium]